MTDRHMTLGRYHVPLLAIFCATPNLLSAAEIGGHTYAGADLSLGANYSFSIGSENVHTWAGVNEWASTTTTSISDAGGKNTVVKIANGGTLNLTSVGDGNEKIKVNGNGDILIQGTFNHNTNGILEINETSTAASNLTINGGGKYVFNTVGSDVGTLRLNRNKNNGNAALHLGTGGTIEVNDSSGSDDAVITRAHHGADGLFTVDGGTINVNQGHLSVTNGGNNVFFRTEGAGATINVAAGASMSIFRASLGDAGGTIGGSLTLLASNNKTEIRNNAVLDFDGNGLTWEAGRLFGGSKSTRTMFNRGVFILNTDALADNNNGLQKVVNDQGGTFVQNDGFNIRGHHQKGFGFDVSDAGASGGAYEFKGSGFIDRALFTVFDGGVLRKSGAGTAEIAEETGSGGRSFTFFDIKSGGSIEVTGGQLNITTEKIKFNGSDGMTPAGNLGFNLLIDGARLNVDSNKGDGSANKGDPIPLVSIGAGSTLDLRQASAQFTNDTTDLLSSLTTVNGTLLISDGYSLTPGGAPATLTVDGGTLGGDSAGVGGIAGDVIAQNGATIAPGLSIGQLDIIGGGGAPGNLDINGPATIELEILDPYGAPGTGYDYLQVAGDVNFDNTGLVTIELVSMLDSDTSGLIPGENFDGTMGFDIHFLEALGNANELTNFTLDGTNFLNDLAGGSFSLSSQDDGLHLIFRAASAEVPEPSTIAIWSLLGIVAAGLAWRKRRR